ncbi:DapH/DapD/GlmU-related protein [Actinomyces procaprae]|uniref:DapH/DapD/GlmU-related protein n=1 Tax=Actinomyces procaprae TaxID=2560010 RepID=UPI0023D8FFF2|nr:DapH/DapD/GlmU-related protein [Actinomyces procaprae]
MAHKDIWDRLRDGDDVDLFEQEYTDIVRVEFARCRDLMFDINLTRPSDPALPGMWGDLLGLDGPLDPSIRLIHPMQIDFGKRMHIAPNVLINHSFTAMLIGGISIGEGTFIGPSVTAVTDNHRLDDVTILNCHPIAIGRRVWIGAGASIMPGVTVGDDAVIAGGAVVTKDVPPRSVVAGVPARVIREK